MPCANSAATPRPTTSSVAAHDANCLANSLQLAPFALPSHRPTPTIPPVMHWQLDVDKPAGRNGKERKKETFVRCASCVLSAVLSGCRQAIGTDHTLAAYAARVCCPMLEAYWLTYGAKCASCKRR
eukprot:GHRR01014534.1.p3 GENE.GHRR01014534.1~~GHRR01014534.1.p3  ORF type:complete len:126 (-),score=23.52 GHRR01014534.1:134-511(-)